MGNIKKIDQIQTNLHTCISEVNKQCAFNFVWNLFGNDTAIIISFVTIFFTYKLAWFNTPSKIIAYFVVILMIITIISFFRWNRTLIKSLLAIKNLSKDLIEETSDLQSRHSELARDHEKNTDRYEILREHYAVLFTAVSLLEQQSIQNTQAQNSRKQDRR